MDPKDWMIRKDGMDSKKLNDSMSSKDEMNRMNLMGSEKCNGKNGLFKVKKAGEGRISGIQCRRIL